MYAQMPTGSNGWAGYFYGDLYSTTDGYYGPSDKNLKENIQRFTGALDRIKELNAYTYNFKKEYTQDYGMPTGTSYGILAQEVESVFPELVKDSKLTSKVDAGKPDAELNIASARKSVDAKSVNYTGLIPVLLQAIKEQQNEIESLNQRLQQLEKK